jgi:hypothetical protein
MTLNPLEMRRLTSSRVRMDEDEHEESRSQRLARENARLAKVNARLRAEYEDLAGSTRMWIRLYEAALDRANAAAAECSRLRQPAAQ